MRETSSCALNALPVSVTEGSLAGGSSLVRPKSDSLATHTALGERLPSGE